MNIKKKFVGIAAAGVLVAGSFGLAATPAMADNVDLEIQAGSLAWTLDNGGVDFGTVNYSLAAQTKSATSDFDLSDMTASDDGWVASMQVTGGMTNATSDNIASTDLYYLPATSSITSAGGDNGGSMTGVSKGTQGDLATSRTIFEASKTNGEGAYTGTVDLSVEIPAGQAPGTYAGTLTVGINPQP